MIDNDARDRDYDGDHTEARPFAEFKDEGLLWLINRVVFHPRGYAIAFHFDDVGSVTGWSLLGDGTEVWAFTEDVEDDLFATVKALLP